MSLLYHIICIYIFLITQYSLIIAMPPLVGPFGDGFQHGFQQQSQFGESIRDWFVDMKDRIFNNVHSPDLSTVVSQAKADVKHQKKMIEGFWLDLPNISLDPDRDWGFRVGPWFIIKKFDDHSDTDILHDLPRAESKNPDSIEHEWDHFNFEKDKLITEIIPTAVTTYNNQKTTIYTTEKNSVFEYNADKKIYLNETYNHATYDQSAEVISQTN